ncbi:transcriptional regulator [Desulfuromonas versatilis]|uniref:Transcriptional regulator n=1 Tax=Desulfuromonas versatilis TaxID=2802975 RepID=A0ABM8HUP4_9BACT|nr:helix-turn-helix transcriptional regulator [Desulfuromonas versatilis]BCR05722.1 transcriptional regulator [Desulfuromonas versatilis]
MENELSPTVSLDGNAVRRIREEKKLTQLYVAKVVGVTTDTISRWENNRTPSVKRDNILRLAEALEVDIAEILEPAPAEEPEGAAEPPAPGRRRRLSLPLLLFVAGALAVLLFALPDDPQVVEVEFPAERWLSSFAAPGSVIPVQVKLGPEAQEHGFILREHFPPGWVLIEAFPPASSLDNETGTARWIVKPSKAPPRISYLVKVPPETPLESEALFSGEVVAKAGSDAPFPVSGISRVEVQPYLWADVDGDGRVDDGEMLQASVIVEEMAGVHLDWSGLEKIWDAGSYRWEKDQHSFVPVRQPVEEPASEPVAEEPKPAWPDEPR